jgi:hypothetical protein
MLTATSMQTTSLSIFIVLRPFTKGAPSHIHQVLSVICGTCLSGTHSRRRSVHVFRRPIGSRDGLLSLIIRTLRQRRGRYTICSRMSAVDLMGGRGPGMTGPATRSTLDSQREISLCDCGDLPVIVETSPSLWSLDCAVVPVRTVN